MPETGTGKVNTTTLGWVSKTGQVRWSNTNNVSEGGKNKLLNIFTPILVMIIGMMIIFFRLDGKKYCGQLS